MPGLHFLLDKTGSPNTGRFQTTLDRIHHDPQYRSELLYDDNSAHLGLTRYAEYPVEVFDDDLWLIVCEGRIYRSDSGDTADNLRRLAMLLSNSREGPHVRDWLLKQDGDFLIAILQKESGRWTFVNDALGRLPLYVYQTQSQLVISRELTFVTGLTGNETLDRMAIAQYLLFGYSLGKRTLIDRVDRVPPSTIIRANSRDGSVSIETVHRFCFDTPELTDTDTIDDTGSRLAETYTAACGRQADPNRTNILSLSGGLDSRAVAAGLIKSKSPFQAFTFLDHAQSALGDSHVARELAGLFDLDWDLIELPPPTGRDLRKILLMKGGMNSVASAATLPFMEEIEKRCGRNLVWFSGDGGDKLLPDLRPSKKLKSTGALANYIVDRNALFPIGIVARLCRLSEVEIRGQLLALLETYPERTPQDKYVHFLIYERAMRWLFEGEDCNRCHFWTATPFYSLPFFREAMSIAAPLKARHRLYQSFLNALSPVATGLVDAGRGVSLDSTAYGRRMDAITRMSQFPGTFRAIKNTLRPPAAYPYSSSTSQTILRQSETCPMIDQYLDSTLLRWIVQQSHEFSREMFDNLLTVTSAIEEYTGDKSSLDEMNDRPFY